MAIGDRLLQGGPTGIRWPMVAARYRHTAGQAIANSGTIIVDFAVKDVDSWGVVTTGASWKFDCPVSGLYHVSARVVAAAFDPAAATSNLFLQIFKAGVVELTGVTPLIDTGTETRSWSVGVEGLISAQRGHDIDIRMQNTSGTSINLTTATTQNYVNIILVDGNNWVGA